jgi:molybdopterin molybdotransferase
MGCDAQGHDGHHHPPRPRGREHRGAGCDVTRGAVVVPKGTRLGPDEICALAAQGLDAIPVATPPSSASSARQRGDPHTARLTPGAIWDCNTSAPRRSCARSGIKPYGIVRDDFDTFLRALKTALPTADDRHRGRHGSRRPGLRQRPRRRAGLPGVLVNGVPMRSGKPLIMGVAGQVPIVCVAGHPPEALRGFRLFGIPALARLLGRKLPAAEHTAS